jgi:dipeptidyl aminopeptidase/acylaminoacyl peptidase
MRIRTAAACTLAGALALGTSALAQNAMTLEDLVELEFVHSPAVSPDGNAVAYGISRYPNVLEGEKNGGSQTEIMVATAAGEGRLYVPADMSPSSVQWRDADTFTFIGSGDDGRALYEMDLTGGAARELFAFDRSISSYTLADDGDLLFFSSTDEENETREKLRDKGFDANIIDEDGSFRRLYRVDLSAADPEAQMLDLDGHVSTFAASPDGSMVAVALAETPLVGDDIINRKFSIVNGRTGEVRSRIETEGKIGEIEFSPNGRRIAFLAGVDRSDPVAVTVAIGDPRDGSFEFLTGEDEADEIDITWTSNDTLRVLAHEGVGSLTYTLSTNGRMSDRTVHDGYVVTGIDGSGRTWAATGSAPDTPSALWVANRNGRLDSWVDLNGWVADRQLGKQEVVTWEARDGVEVEGLLITPQGRRPGGGWPMITVVHGGPEAHYSNGWLTAYSLPGHVGAANGYAVFYPNYRGSTGRGQAFAKLDHQDPPAAEFNDIVDGIEALAERGLIDADRVGITGGSYGGYASAWGATALTEHFAAAVVFVALTDLTSFMGTTDIPEEMIDSHFMTYPEDDWDMYREQSPIYHAAKSKTPTLILHGEADPRVHPSQSLQLFRYLQRVGQAPVRLVTYPDEGHGNRRAASRYDYSLRMMRWFDTYLKGDATSELPPVTPPQLEALVD